MLDMLLSIIVCNIKFIRHLFVELCEKNEIQMIFFAIATDNPGKKYLERPAHFLQSQCNNMT